MSRGYFGSHSRSIDHGSAKHYIGGMGQAVLSVRMDEALKKQFDLLCDDMGMNASTAVTIFAKTVVRERRIPFAIATPEDPFWGETNQAHLRAAIADINAGKHSAHALIETADD